jgi:hypothetical protein
MVLPALRETDRDLHVRVSVAFGSPIYAGPEPVTSGFSPFALLEVGALGDRPSALDEV